ncbi:hypothetical protein J6590_100425 [Homalodisca vitripennis]|nr:hypothetical protein J6590_100425 [Homalodisca vitripennis]
MDTRTLNDLVPESLYFVTPKHPKRPAFGAAGLESFQLLSFLHVPTTFWETRSLVVLGLCQHPACNSPWLLVFGSFGSSWLVRFQPLAPSVLRKFLVSLTFGSFPSALSAPYL